MEQAYKSCLTSSPASFDCTKQIINTSRNVFFALFQREKKGLLKMIFKKMECIVCVFERILPFMISYHHPFMTKKDRKKEK